MTLPRLSLRWRLVGLFLALALASTVVFLGGLQRAVAAGWQTWAQPLLGDYVDRLAADLGSPPDPVRAAALEARLPVRVRIEGPVVRYDGSPSPYGESRWRHRDDDDGDTPFALVRTTGDGHRITLGLAAPPDGWRPRGGTWVPVTVLLVCTALAYALVRRWMPSAQGPSATAAAASTSASPRAEVTNWGVWPTASTPWRAACTACCRRSARSCWRSATSCAAP